jgi:hypothetical protein
MNGAPFLVLDRTSFIHGITDDVDDAAERSVADRDGDRLPGVDDLLSAHQSLADVHGYGTNRRFAEMLSNLEHQAIALVLGLERIEDRGKMPLELHVDNGADNLRNASD